MASVEREQLRALQQEAERFASTEIAPRADLVTATGLPRDLWHKLGRAGLLGVGVPAEHGGRGGTYEALALAGESLVEHGGNLGIALSWMVHNVVARFIIVRCGNTTQQKELLPLLASGKRTIALGVSEPEAGAHPRRMRTCAAVDGDRVRLDGAKSFLTNGPIADLFVVIACTGESANRRDFSAFLVPRGTPGLTIGAPLMLEFLRSAPHCAITLADCSVPATSVLGRPGAAYEELVKPLRVVEDALLLGPIIGALACQLRQISAAISVRGFDLGGQETDKLGELESLIEVARTAARAAACMLDEEPQSAQLVPVVLGCRTLAGTIQSGLGGFRRGKRVSEGTSLESLADDTDRVIHLGERVASRKRRRLAAARLAGERQVGSGLTGVRPTGAK